MDKEYLKISSFLSMTRTEIAKYHKDDVVLFCMRIFDSKMQSNSTFLKKEAFIRNIKKMLKKEFVCLNTERTAFCSLSITPKKIAPRGLFNVRRSKR